MGLYTNAHQGKGFTGLLTERMNVAKTLWDAGIKAEFSWKVKPKLPNQFKEAEKGGVPFAVLFGEEEISQGKVKIKEMGLPDGHPDKDGVNVDLSNLVSEVRSRIQAKADKEVGEIVNGTSALGVAE